MLAHSKYIYKKKGCELKLRFSLYWRTTGQSRSSRSKRCGTSTNTTGFPQHCNNYCVCFQVILVKQEELLTQVTNLKACIMWWTMSKPYTALPWLPSVPTYNFYFSLPSLVQWFCFVLWTKIWIPKWINKKINKYSGSQIHKYKIKTLARSLEKMLTLNFLMAQLCEAYYYVWWFFWWGWWGR